MTAFFSRPLVISATILASGLLSAFAIVLGSIALVRVGDQADDITRVVTSIQSERVHNTRDGCLQTNARNAATKHQFDGRTGVSAEARSFTFALIDALAPLRDCDAVVARQTGASTSKTP